MANPPPTRTAIVVQGDTSLTALFVNKRFDISFGVVSTYSTAVTPTYQLCNSYSGLASYITSNGSNFAGAFPSTGFKQFLQVDALIPTGTTVVSTYRSALLGTGFPASFPAWDSSGRMYFSDTRSRIYRMTVDNSYEVFAGQATTGFTDGDRLTTATFTTPRGMVFDSSGNLILAMETSIRKINTTTGQVTTLAGPSSAIFDWGDGTGTAVRFNGASAIALETGGTGNFMIADTSNNCIRKMTPTGTVTTVIGGGGFNGAGYADGTGTTALFRTIADFTYAPNGTMYVVDQGNFLIRSVTPSTYIVSTHAGSFDSNTLNGPLREAGFGTPSSIVSDPSGLLYVAEKGGSVIRRLDSTTVTTWAGAVGVASYIDGGLSTARFEYPETMRRYGDTLYLTDSVSPYRMRAITTLGSATQFPLVNRPAGFTVMDSCSYPITVNSRIDVSWTSVGGTLPLFKFEPFSNTFTANRCGGQTNDTLTYATTSTELLGYLSGTGTSNVLFRSTNGASIAYTQPLTLAVRAVSNSTTVVEEVSTAVTIKPARIVYSPCNAVLTFYRNEPAPTTTFSLVASDMSLIYSATTLPVGLRFVRSDVCSFILTGTPTVQTIASNYTFLAFDTRSRTYSTQLSMVVNPERLILNADGPLTQSNVGTAAPIEPITFTADFPPYATQRSMRYTWSAVPPAGIQFRDICGTAISGLSYSVTGLSNFPLTLSGTVTEEQLRIYASNGTQPFTMTLTGTRTSPIPALSPSLAKTITFRFRETLFFSSNVPTLFAGLVVSNTYYTATTYFPAETDTSLASIVVSDGFLPDGLTGTFTVPSQRFTLTGTPTVPGFYSFTLTATNGSGVSANLPVTVRVLNDFVTITPSATSPFGFIQTRSLSNQTATYPYPIRFSVTSASGCNAIATGSNLPSGVTLVGSNGVYDLSGRPLTATGLTTAYVTGSVPSTGASATTTFQYSVSAEAFTFPRDICDVSFDFIQNVPITPVRLSVTTLSENSVIRFSAPTIPSALQVTNAGIVSGTLLGDTSGTFDVLAFTAYATGTKTYTYRSTPDQILLQPTVYTTTTAPGRSVSIPILGYSLSAVTVSNFRFQSAFPYGLSINPTTGLLSGTLASSLPSSTTFTLLGSVGLASGSLVGTMTTNNLTVDRAQVIEIQNQSNLRIYFSDTQGSTWTLGASSNGLVAGRLGANGSTTSLVPTSSDTVLRSTTGSTYTSLSLGQSAKSPLMTAVVHKPGSSTWWIAGTLSNVTRSVYVFKSTDDGLTWDAGTLVAGMQDRSSNTTPGTGVYDAYLYGGLDLAYRDGVLLLGGSQIARSTDDGATWTSVSSPLLEVARFSLDQGTVWLAVGSDRYASRNENPYTADATTVVYSVDQGVSWTAASGGFTMNAYEIVYGNGVWLATGLDWSGSAFVGRVRYSYDGLGWAPLTSIPSVTYSTTLSVRPPGSMGAIGYDGIVWSVLRSPNDGTTTLFSHPVSTPIDIGWTTTSVTSQFPGSGSLSRFSSYVTQTIDPGADVTTITFPLPTTGPTFTSPAQSTYFVWQYMPIPAISFAATGATAFFVSTLPVGLTWNSTTRTLTGACMRLGTQSFTVYAKNGTAGITAFSVTMVVSVPRVVRKQTSAGAYTSLVRDYTEVNAAINARDSRVFPTEEAALGSFASPYAPDVVTASNCPC